MNHSNIKTHPEVARILRVDHAGEKGAIQIYTSQAFIARLFYPDLLAQLQEMLSHEKEHYNIFDEILKRRKIRSCYSLFLWGLGGSILGTITGLLGRKAIGVTTDSVETTVLDHLEWQLEFLRNTDHEVYEAVQSIYSSELDHRDWGKETGATSTIYAPIRWIVSITTSFAIWLSTKL